LAEIGVDAAIRSKKTPKNNEEIKTEIGKLIDETPTTGKLPRGKIIECLKQDSAWGIVKQNGERGLPRGDIRTKFSSLTQYLESIGIFVIKVGEIETFCPDIGGHGPNFVNSLLSTVSLGDPKLDDLKAFVRLVHQSEVKPIA
jgi:hypothetical protein